MAIQPGYSATVVAYPYAGAEVDLPLSQDPDVRRTWSIKYDTVRLTLNNEAGVLLVHKKDRLIVRLDGVMVFHGFVVSQPSIRFSVDGANVEVLAASMPFLLAKKHLKGPGGVQVLSLRGTDVDAIKAILARDTRQTYAPTQNSDLATHSNTQFLNGRLQLAGTPGSYLSPGVATYPGIQVLGDVVSVDLMADVVNNLTSSFVDELVDTSKVDPTGTAYFDALFGGMRLNDRLEVDSQPFDLPSVLASAQNVAISNGSLRLPGQTLNIDYDTPASYVAVAGTPQTLGTPETGSSGGFGLFHYRDPVTRNDWFALGNTGATRTFDAADALTVGTPPYPFTQTPFGGNNGPSQELLFYQGQVFATDLLALNVAHFVIWNGANFVAQSIIPDLTLPTSGTFGFGFSPFSAFLSPYGGEIWLITPDSVNGPARGYRLISNAWVRDDSICVGLPAAVSSYPGVFGHLKAGVAVYSDYSGVAGAKALFYDLDAAAWKPYSTLNFGQYPVGHVQPAIATNIGGVGNPWNIQHSNAATLTLATIGTGHGANSSRVGAGQAYFHQPSVSSKIGTLSLDFYREPGGAGYFTFADGAFVFRVTTAGRVEWRNAGGVYQGLPTDTTLTVSTWANFRFEFDGQAANPASWTCEVYVDGVDKGAITYATASDGVFGLIQLGRTDGANQDFGVDSITLYPAIGAQSNLHGVGVVQNYAAALKVHRAYIEVQDTKPTGSTTAYELSVDGGTSWQAFVPTTNPSTPNWVNILTGQTINVLIRITLDAPDVAHLPTVESYQVTLASGYATPATYQSLQLSDGSVVAADILLDVSTGVNLPPGCAISWFVSSNGGVNFTTHPGPGGSANIPLAQRGTDVRVRAVLSTTDQNVTPLITRIQGSVSASSAPTTVQFAVSRDGGITYHNVANPGTIVLTGFAGESPRNSFMLKVTLTTSDPTVSPSVGAVTVTIHAGGYDYVKLGTEGTDVVSLEPNYPIDYFWEQADKALETLQGATLADAWWALDPATGVYYLHYNSPRPALLGPLMAPLLDSSGNDRSLYPQGAVPPSLIVSPWTKFYGAALLDGAANYFDAGALFNVNGQFTVEAKVRRDRQGVTEVIASKWGGAVAGQRNFRLYFDGATNKAAIQVVNGTPAVVTLLSAAAVPNGVHDIAASWDSATLRIFVDGALSNSVALTTQEAPDATTPVRIGADASGAALAPAAFLLGAVDEVRISNVARYVAAYTPSTTPFTPLAGTVALWHMDAPPAIGRIGNEVLRLEGVLDAIGYADRQILLGHRGS